MKLRVDVEQHYIRATVENHGREAVIRRWPWPNDPPGRKANFCAASEYVDALAAVLACPVEIAQS